MGSCLGESHLIPLKIIEIINLCLKSHNNERSSSSRWLQWTRVVPNYFGLMPNSNWAVTHGFWWCSSNSIISLHPMFDWSQSVTSVPFVIFKDIDHWPLTTYKKRKKQKKKNIHRKNSHSVTDDEVWFVNTFWKVFIYLFLD